MTITLTFRDLLLTVLTLFICSGIVYFIAVLKRLKAVAEQMEKTAQQVRDFLPRVDRLAVDASDALRSVRALVESGQQAVDDVTAVTSRFRAVAGEGLGYLETILEPLRRIAALATGIQAGFRVFRSWTGRSDEYLDETEED